MALSLVSLNVEGSRHIERVGPFLGTREADVICLQELRHSDVGNLERALGMRCFFTPMKIVEEASSRDQEGLGVFSALPMRAKRAHRYAGVEPSVPVDRTSVETLHATQGYLAALIEVEKAGTEYRIATTHFPWTPDGSADEYQRGALGSLLATLEGEGELVLCGDFNAPRGGEIYEGFAARYADAIPAIYRTSIDVELHQHGATRRQELENRMVDYVFTTPPYAARDVSLEFGVSDHAAVVATIDRA